MRLSTAVLQLAAVPAAALPCACGAGTGKPVDTHALRLAARPKLAEYLRRAVGKQGADEVRLIDARPFSEGHVHPTWQLFAVVGGKRQAYALKVFPDEAVAAAAADNYRVARELGWPVPADVARGSATPYADRPASLQELVPGRSLGATIEALLRRKPPATDEGIAALYGQLGRVLGGLHAKGKRPRRDGDLSGTRAMRELTRRCQADDWCKPALRVQLGDRAAGLDGPEVTFVHGDLYESQVIFLEPARLVAFVDLDRAGYGDPALDVGSLLAHVVLVNPLARWPVWGVPDPTEAETKASAEWFLAEYRKAAGISDGWAAFLERVRGYMLLRIGRLLLELRGNVHAYPLLGLVQTGKEELLSGDPLARCGIAAE